MAVIELKGAVNQEMLDRPKVSRLQRITFNVRREEIKQCSGAGEVKAISDSWWILKDHFFVRQNFC